MHTFAFIVFVRYPLQFVACGVLGTLLYAASLQLCQTRVLCLQECARYLETFKSYETKPASAIQERSDTDYVGRLTSALTTVRGLNRNDAYTLGTKFGTLADIFRGNMEQFSACPGLGPVKGRRLFDTFNEPFRKPLRAPGAVAGGSQPGSSGSSPLEKQ